MQKIVKNQIILLMLLLSGSLSFTSCETEFPDDTGKAGLLALSTSTTEVELTQKQATTPALSFNWTTGTNNGTGASISYMLEIDKQGNNFANPIRLDMGKGKYTHGFTHRALNDSLLNHWSATPGIPVVLEARVISTVFSDPVAGENSETVLVSITPYEPVSNRLFIIGSASPRGWNADNATELTAQSDPTIFVYQGSLVAGTFKFITTPGQFLPSYNKGTDDTNIVLRRNDHDPDDQFTITEAAVYRITVSLLDLTISIAKANLPPYNEIYMVGDASPNGWDISNATQMVQDQSNPYLFRYRGVMKVGDFKFPVNRNGDFGQDMFMRKSDAEIYLHKGGDPDDEKWHIDKKGYYTITLDLLNYTINMQREKLFMVGSATPIGWNIGDAIELSEDATDGCIFVYSGPMVAGEFKFPVNRNSDWGQDMYMRTSDTKMYRHKGGDPDDEKWNISSSGNYTITTNIETLDISIIKL